jgi:ketosteroid isomerase-like protein
MSGPTEISAPKHDPISVATTSYRAYVEKDRATLERLIAEDFRFSSPLDNRIDRQTYFARCWPNSAWLTNFKFIHLVDEGGRVFVTYEASTDRGKVFRNTEILTVRDGKIVEVEVYFGWPIPHEAPAGGFKNP